MQRKKIKLGQMLIDAGLIDEFQLNSALSHQRNCGGGRLGSSLIKLKYISEENLLTFLSEQLNLPRVDLSRQRIPPEVLAHIPAEKAWEYRAVPIDRREMHGTSYLLVAMGDPTDLTAVDALQFMTGCRVRPALAFDSAIVEALVHHYGPLVTEEDLFEPEPQMFAQELADPADASAASRQPAGTTEEKFLQLLKILLDKGILSLREFERLK